MDPWYRRLFDGFYYDVWFRRGALGATPERTAAEVDFIERVLALPPGAAILDLACGHGRHAVELARRSYRVTGLDLSPQHLTLARQAAADAGVEVEWLEADMRDVPPGPFDAVINMFTAFGYLESDADDQTVLDGVGRALRPGGRFLIDIHSREHFVRDFRSHVWYPLGDGSLVLEERQLDLLSSRVTTRVTLIEPDGTRESRTFVVRAYSLTELARMLAHAGLSVTQTWGGFDASPYTLTSIRLILLAQRSG